MSGLHVRCYKRRDSFQLELNFSAPQSGVIALFGQSGCGKTTAINTIAGLLSPDHGRIELGDALLFDSERRVDLPPEQRGIGYVFQDARLFPHLSVTGICTTDCVAIDQSRQHFDFEHIVELLGLQHLLHRRPHLLSGGEQQRVALGRALLSQPRLLLLDEPLASLDQARRNEVLPYLERVRDELQIPMVYVSHQFDEVLRLASHVVLLDHGQILAQGPLQEISLLPQLRQIVGAEAIGAVVEATVLGVNADTGLAQVSIGNGVISVDAQHLQVAQKIRIQLLARDLILALQPPTQLSIRNQLTGRVVEIKADDKHTSLVSVEVGGVTLLSRITNSAVEELQLRRDLNLWVLVKAVTLRGHVYASSDLANRN